MSSSTDAIKSADGVNSGRFLTAGDDGSDEENDNDPELDACATARNCAAGWYF